jgi:hypothetical protein
MYWSDNMADAAASILVLCLLGHPSSVWRMRCSHQEERSGVTDHTIPVFVTPGEGKPGTTFRKEEEQKLWADSPRKGGKKRERKEKNQGKIVSKLNVFHYFQCGVCRAPR